MSREFRAVHERAEAIGCDMRTAAYVHALDRIGGAIAAQGTQRYFTNDGRGG
jgi:glutamate dehydrogenase (NADP+)